MLVDGSGTLVSDGGVGDGTFDVGFRGTVRDWLVGLVWRGVFVESCRSLGCCVRCFVPWDTDVAGYPDKVERRRDAGQQGADCLSVERVVLDALKK